jgi:hypothetical protein
MFDVDVASTLSIADPDEDVGAHEDACVAC